MHEQDETNYDNKSMVSSSLRKKEKIFLLIVKKII
jgi:hypothetical protein